MNTRVVLFVVLVYLLHGLGFQHFQVIICFKLFVSFKIIVIVINSVFKSRFWFSLAGDGSPFRLEESSAHCGFASSLRVSPGYKVALPTCTDLGENDFSWRKCRPQFP